MGVGFVSVLGYEFAVNANVELSVTTGDEGEGANVVADAVEGVAGHPGGAEGVASIVAVFYLDGVFFGVGHGGGSFGGLLVCGKRRGFWVLASFRFSFDDDSFANRIWGRIRRGSGCFGDSYLFFLFLGKRVVGVEMLQDRPSFADAPHTGWDEEMWRRCSWG